ncbi:MAG: SDR family NAD(P)-dependent oxidoreductase [Prevotella sp.]|nr:SDR family NAD(P)-dependent oxidoreductase [Prevotella sp.]
MILHTFKWLIYPSPHVKPEKLKRHFSGKRIVVTGASKGIGKALVYSLIEARANIVLIARDEKELSKLCSDARIKGCEADYYAVDLRDREVLSALCSELHDRYSEVDYFFCNAGKSICRLIEDALDRLHDFDRTMDVNYRSLVALSLAIIPSLVKSKGRIIYTSSVSTLYPAFGGWSAYHSSKVAANMWCRTASKELKSKGVKVQIAYMPLVHTAMADVNPRYKELPGYSASEAATLLLRLAMNGNSCFMPWWARISWRIASIFGKA